MNIFKNRINVDDYLKASKVKWNYDFDNTIHEQGEYLIAIEIVEKYRKQNRFNLFKSLNESYRPYIKYGKISLISGKFVYISLFLMIILLIPLYLLVKYIAFFYIFIMILLLISLFIYMKFIDKYEKEKEKYEKEKKNPNWKRKQIMKRLLKN